MKNVTNAEDKKSNKKVKVPKIKLVSYSMKMTIPTGQYANIIPEIVIKAESVEQAHDFIAPHMNKLWKEYYMVSERRPADKPEPIGPKQPLGTVYGIDNKPVTPKQPIVVITPERTTQEPQTKSQEPGTPVLDKPEDENPVSSVAFVKASQAINSCLGLDALNLITEQVKKSVKLNDQEKDKLMVLIINKTKEINGRETK